MSNEHQRQWAERLEAGAEDDELLALAARLRRAGAATRATPSLALQRQLRRDLMKQSSSAPSRAANIGRWAGSLAAVALLVVVVGLMWLSISSAGRPTFGGSPPPAYQLLEHTVSVAAPADGAANLPGDALSPDVTLVVAMRWSLPPEAGEVMALVHLLNANGQVIAQADVPLQPAIEPTAEGQATATASMTVTADMAANATELVAGLYDPATGARLPLGSDGETTVGLGEVPVAPPIEAEGSGGAEAIDATLTVRDVSPATGAILTGTQPITFTVRLAYDTINPPALLELKIAETVGENGRGVATARVTLDRASGEITVPVVLYPAQELNAPAELGLWLQLRADADAPPELIEMPEAYRWRYTP